jgi:hypothetical protein
MITYRFTIKIFAIALFMFAFASLAQAQATRTWVSGVGDDLNPCSRTAPCKTFAGAISKTAACGEISVLDPGGFGAVTITKSITIDGTGTLAGILASLTTGMVINASSSDVVTIRGVSINGNCNGVRGMNILNAKTVNVEDCVIYRFLNEGILINTTGAVFLQVTNTVIRDNAGDGISATTSFAGPARVRVSLDRVRSSGNGQNGLHARSGASFTVRNSVFASNVANGIFCDAAGTVFAGVTVAASQVWGNGQNGVRAGNAGNLGGSGVQISQNQIEGNSNNGVLVSTGGVVNTFNNNDILGNGVDACPACINVSPGK